ncbi:MAG: hypothetical protein SGARI_003714 [Bacillariaceae sp.]
MGMSRRQQPPSTPTPASVEMLPLHQRSAKAKRKASDAAGLLSNGAIEGPPRSGQFSLTAALMDNLDFLGSSSNDKKSSRKHHHPHPSSPKRKFQVEIPRKLMIILAAVFLIAPLLTFLHKEAHIHENHDEAHYKPERFVNVDADAVLSQFRAKNASLSHSGDETLQLDSNNTAHFVEKRGEEKPPVEGETMHHVDMHMDENPKANATTTTVNNNQTTSSESTDKSAHDESNNQLLLNTTIRAATNETEEEKDG